MQQSTTTARPGWNDPPDEWRKVAGVTGAMPDYGRTVTSFSRMTKRPSPRDVDDARLLPHLRHQQPVLIVSPDNGTTHVQTLQLGGKRTTSTLAQGEPGDLRGIPVVGARGVTGVQPGTQPEQETIRRTTRKEQAA